MPVRCIRRVVPRLPVDPGVDSARHTRDPLARANLVVEPARRVTQSVACVAG
jgi:hypothetical protein